MSAIEWNRKQTEVNVNACLILKTAIMHRSVEVYPQRAPGHSWDSDRALSDHTGDSHNTNSVWHESDIKVVEI